jgi:hypothetical protein
LVVAVALFTAGVSVRAVLTVVEFALTTVVSARGMQMHCMHDVVYSSLASPHSGCGCGGGVHGYSRVRNRECPVVMCVHQVLVQVMRGHCHAWSLSRVATVVCGAYHCTHGLHCTAHICTATDRECNSLAKSMVSVAPGNEHLRSRNVATMCPGVVIPSTCVPQNGGPAAGARRAVATRHGTHAATIAAGSLLALTSDWPDSSVISPQFEMLSVQHRWPSSVVAAESTRPDRFSIHIGSCCQDDLFGCLSY